MAATIKDIRDKYPQYNDLSDQELVSGFHKKFYSDIPFDEFSQRIGFTPQETTQEKASPVQQEQSWLEKAGLTMKGREGTQSVLKTAVQEPLVGFAKGLVTDLPVGLAQLGANVLGSEDTAAKANELVNQYEDLGGSTVTRIAGAMANPLNRFLVPGVGSGTASITAKSALAGAGTSAISPTEVKEGEDYLNNKSVQVALGAVLGGAIPLTALGLGKLINVIGENVNLSKNAKLNRIREYLNGLVGKERDAVIKDLENAGEFVTGSKPTVMQAIGDRPSASNLLAEQQRLAPKFGPDFNVRAAEQEAARQAAVGRIASPRGATLEQVAEARTGATGDLREQALQRANVYGEQAPMIQQNIDEAVGGVRNPLTGAVESPGAVGALQAQGVAQTEAAQAINRAHNWTPVPGMPRFPGRYSPNMDRALEQKTLANEMGELVDVKKAQAAFNKAELESLNKNGFFPLETKPIVSTIIDSVNKPGIRSKEGLPQIMSGIANRLEEFTNARGYIDSQDLYSIRQTLNSNIKSTLKQNNIEAGDKLVLGLEKQVRGLIDEAITKASGTKQWGEYLKNYSKYSQKMDRMKVGQSLLDTLGGRGGDLGAEQAGKFVEAITNSKALVKKATANPFYNTIEDVMTKRELNQLNAVASDLKRSAAAERLASKTTPPSANTEGITPPPLLDYRISVVNSVLNAARKNDVEAMNRTVADLMLDPQKMAAFLQEPNKGKMDVLLNAIGKTVSTDIAKQFISRVGIATGQKVSE